MTACSNGLPSALVMKQAGSRSLGDGRILKRIAKDSVSHTSPVPRARGAAELSVKARGNKTVVERLRTSGCMKLLFPVAETQLKAIMLNTAGGLTGGDALSLKATVGASASLCMTTQAAERAYLSQNRCAHIRSDLRLEAGATLYWLPQELILFEGAALTRHLSVNLAPTAKLLLVEPVIFGRAAMGERLHDIQFADHVEVRRDGAPLYRDAIRISGDLIRQLAGLATAQNAGAMANLLYVGADAETNLPSLRTMLPEAGGATLLQADVLALRLLATDGFELRRFLLPIIERLSADTLPTSWRL